MKRAVALLTLGLLSACASPPPLAPVAATAPVPVVQAPVYTPPPTPIDQCGASKLQTLVGQPRTEIPVPVIPGTRRVTCTTCPVTRDYLPGRLNILFDQETGIIREVRCG